MGAAGNKKPKKAKTAKHAPRYALSCGFHFLKRSGTNGAGSFLVLLQVGKVAFSKTLHYLCK